MNRANRALLLRLIGREVRSRFIGSATGWVWLILNPLLLLGVYGFVFGVIFQARVPPGLDMPFVAWLAVALWPWLMFSEGVLRGAQAIREHAALISKVALKRELLVIASVSAVFLLHLFGYVTVLTLIGFLADLTWLGMFRLSLALVGLYALALGLGLGLSAVQVFVRDLEQAMPTLFMFWFFLTPILYAPSLVPESLVDWLYWNPLTWVMGEIRAGILHGEPVPGVAAGLLLLGGLLTLWLGWRLFARLNPYFEDFL
ncbi:MAG: ABC transporter permease [Gammaproteobacteria bacterium]|jgi:ABC-type polysaccharide/polyol phosphate export permease|nr:ABC transporter permease [Gammaproteobacteria bacterium]